MRDAAESDAVVREHVRGVLQIVPDFRRAAREPSPQSCERRIAAELLRRARITVRERHVRRFARRDAEREAAELGAHVAVARGLDDERRERRGLELRDPMIELDDGGHGHVMARDRLRRSGRPRPDSAAAARALCVRRRAAVASDPTQQAPELEPLEHAREPRNVGRAQMQIVERERQLDVATDRRELLRQIERVERGAQPIADLARHLRGVRLERRDVGVLLEPLRGRLRPDAVDARDVVDRVADQREVVRDLLRRHAELRDHARAIELRVVHRVDERHVLVDELREVLVAGRDHGVAARARRGARERADHVVGLDALDAEQRYAHRLDRLEQRLAPARAARPASAGGAPCTRRRGRCGTSCPARRTRPPSRSARSRRAACRACSRRRARRSSVGPSRSRAAVARGTRDRDKRSRRRERAVWRSFLGAHLLRPSSSGRGVAPGAPPGGGSVGAPAPGAPVGGGDSGAVRRPCRGAGSGAGIPTASAARAGRSPRATRTPQARPRRRTRCAYGGSFLFRRRELGRDAPIRLAERQRLP